MRGVGGTEFVSRVLRPNSGLRNSLILFRNKLIFTLKKI